MQIPIARIPEDGCTYDGADAPEIMEMENDPAMKVEGDVLYSLFVQRVSGELVVRGTLRLPLALRCRRCAEFFSTTVTDSDFLRAYPISVDVDSVDISPDMREDLLLYIPSFPLCSGSCKGLCSTCGADLNQGACTCPAENGPSPWSALDGLDL